MAELGLGQVGLVEAPLVGGDEVALEDEDEIEAEPGWDWLQQLGPFLDVAVVVLARRIEAHVP